MPSGKQILLSLLTEYSQRKTASADLETATQRIKAGLLLHGSSSNAMWKMVDQMAWLDRLNETEGRPSYLSGQGLGLKKSGHLLSELFALMTESSDIPEHIKADCPELTPDAYKAGLHMIWLLLHALEWSSEMVEVEDNGALDAEEKERLIEAYERKLTDFQNDPEDFS